MKDKNNNIVLVLIVKFIKQHSNENFIKSSNKNSPLKNQNINEENWEYKINKNLSI